MSELLTRMRHELGDDAVVAWDIVEPELFPLDHAILVYLDFVGDGPTRFVLANDAEGRWRYVAAFIVAANKWVARRLAFSQHVDPTTAFADIQLESVHEFRSRIDVVRAATLHREWR